MHYKSPAFISKCSYVMQSGKSCHMVKFERMNKNLEKEGENMITVC